MFEIQKASVKDIPLIRELALKVWPQTYASMISAAQIGYMLDMMYSEASLKKQISDGARFIFIYENKEPVGFASYQEMSPAVFKLHKLYVLPSQQGKGTGRYIIEHIVSEIKPLGAQVLQLQVNRRNKAQHFYAKNGFTVIKEFDFDIGSGYVMDDYVMEKKL